MVMCQQADHQEVLVVTKSSALATTDTPMKQRYVEVILCYIQDSSENHPARSGVQHTLCRDSEEMHPH